LLGVYTFVFNQRDNGGEQLTLTTKWYDNGDGVPQGVFLKQELTLMSYGNSASFMLAGCLTPKNLRQLANGLDSTQAKL
jgi:hypothetical protein